MTIQTKTTLKNIFVTNAKPTQQNYTDLFDSIPFLESNEALPAKYLKLPLLAESAVTTPSAGTYGLFLNSDEGNKLFVINSAGEFYPVSGNKYLTFPFNYADFSATGQRVLMITSVPIKIKSIKASSLYVGNYSMDMYHISSNGNTSTAQSVVAGVAVDSPSATAYTEQSFTVVDDTIPAGRVIVLGIQVNSGAFISNVTIEYTEDL